MALAEVFKERSTGIGAVLIVAFIVLLSLALIVELILTTLLGIASYPERVADNKVQFNRSLTKSFDIQSRLEDEYYQYWTSGQRLLVYEKDRVVINEEVKGVIRKLKRDDTVGIEAEYFMLSDVLGTISLCSSYHVGTTECPTTTFFEIDNQLKAVQEEFEKE